MKENAFAQKITRGLRDCNGLVLSVVGSRMQENSWPDIYVAHRYWRGWIEFKGWKTVLRKAQIHKMDELWKRGAQVYVVRFPNLIQSHKGLDICTFNPEVRVDLLKVLRDLE